MEYANGKGVKTKSSNVCLMSSVNKILIYLIVSRHTLFTLDIIVRFQKTANLITCQVNSKQGWVEGLHKWPQSVASQRRNWCGNIEQGTFPWLDRSRQGKKTRLLPLVVLFITVIVIRVSISKFFISAAERTNNCCQRKTGTPQSHLQVNQAH